MESNSVKTGVDALLEILKQKQKIALSEAAKLLSMQEDTIKLWVDFLVEEKVIGIEYKFTKPFIYLNNPKEERQGRIIEQEKINIDHFKEDFETRAAQSNIPKQQVVHLWKDHILNQLELEKPFFFREARKRSLNNIETQWEKYKERLLSG